MSKKRAAKKRYTPKAVHRPTKPVDTVAGSSGAVLPDYASDQLSPLSNKVADEYQAMPADQRSWRKAAAAAVNDRKELRPEGPAVNWTHGVGEPHTNSERQRWGQAADDVMQVFDPSGRDLAHPDDAIIETAREGLVATSREAVARTGQGRNSGISEALASEDPLGSVGALVDAAGDVVDLMKARREDRRAAQQDEIRANDALAEAGSSSRGGEVRVDGRRVGSVEPVSTRGTPGAVSPGAATHFSPAIGNVDTGSWRRRRSTLHDDLVARHGRVWDREYGLWVDCGSMCPSSACVHFDITNVLRLLNAEDFQAAARETFERLNVSLDLPSVYQDDPVGFDRAFYTTLREQYPRPTPPYGEVFLECAGVTSDGAREGRVGCHLVATGISEDAELAPVMAAWSQRIGVRFKANDYVGVPEADLGSPVFRLSGVIYGDDVVTQDDKAGTGWPTLVAAFHVRLDADGEVVGMEWDPTSPAELMRLRSPAGYRESQAATGFVMTFIRASLLTFSLCNARNIRQVVTREAKAPSKKHARKNSDARPTVEVREIRIDGTKAPTDDRAEPATKRGPVKAHSYRSHWRHYGPKYGTGLLFGKYEALIFQPAGRRGLEALGTVDHTYRVVPRDGVKVKRS